MKTVVLSAYQVLRALAESDALVAYRDVQVSYANVWPGKLIFSVVNDQGQRKNCLIPVWQVKISEQDWNKAGVAGKKTEFLYLNLNGEKVVHPLTAMFERVSPGAVFKYADGSAYMLQECDDLHHKRFVPEPKYSIGLQKFPILTVCEG